MRALACWRGALMVVMVVGCGRAPSDSSSVDSTPTNPSTVGHSAPSETEASPSGDSAAVAEIASDFEMTTPAAAEKQPPETFPTVAKTLVQWKKPEANPTAEQLKLWRAPAHQPLELLAIRDPKDVVFASCAVVTPDGKQCVLAGARVNLLGTLSEEPARELANLSAVDDSIVAKSLDISPDGQMLYLGDSAGTLHVWKMSDNSVVASKKTGLNAVLDLAISPDGSELAMIAYDSTVHIWSAEKLEERSQIKVDTRGVERVVYLGADRVVVFGESTSVWNVSDGKKIKSLEGGRYARSVAVSADRSSLFTGSEDALRQWDSEANEVLSIAGGFANNELIAESPDHRLLATANGNSVRIWDVSIKTMVQVIDAVGVSVVSIAWLPQPNLLMIVTDNGMIRLWGTREEGDKAGLKPVHSQVAMPNTDQHEPAWGAALLQVVDLRVLPVIPGSETLVLNETSYTGSTKLSIDEAKLFYRYQLGQHGWLESTEVSPNPGMITFGKDGYVLKGMFYDQGDGSTSVSLACSGNFDLRWLPKSDAAPIEMVYESDDVVMYKTPANMVALEVDLYRKMHKAGWTAYSRLKTSHREDADRREITFIKNAVEVHISLAKGQPNNEQLMVQYGRFHTMHGIPIPPDSGFVEFEGSTEPELVATTKLSLDEAIAYYEAAMPSQGWLLRAAAKNTDGDRGWAHFLLGQRDVFIGFEKLESGRTLVRIGEDLEQHSWQLNKADVEDDKKDEQSRDGLEAADVPIANAVDDSLKYDTRGKTIEFQSKTLPLSELTSKYTDALTALGWEAQKFGVKSDEYTLLEFKKGELELQIRMTARADHAEVNIQGDGLLWNKEVAAGKASISYATWLRDHKHPATLDLLDEFQREMQTP